MMDNYITQEQSLYMPTVCPVCGEKIVWKGVHIMCPNANCADSAMQDVLIWMNNVVPTDGLGDTLRLKFLKELMGDKVSIEEIYARGQLTEAPEIHTVTYNKFVQTYNSMFTVKVPLVNAILALNIPRFGDVTAEKLAQYPEAVGLLSEGIMPHMLESKVGTANFQSVVQNFSKFQRLKYLNVDYSDVPEQVELKPVAITGTLSCKRSLYEQVLKEHGFIATGSVTKNTFALITNDPSSGSSKNVSAQKYGVPIYTEAEFNTKYIN